MGGKNIKKLACGGIQISNLKIVQNLLAENELTKCNTNSTPLVANSDLSARCQDEEQADIKKMKIQWVCFALLLTPRISQYIGY